MLLVKSYVMLGSQQVIYISGHIFSRMVFNVCMDILCLKLLWYLSVFICVLNNFTALNADQNQPIFHFSKEDITRGEINRKSDEIEIELNTNTYKHEKPCADDYEPQTSKKFTNVTPNSPRNSDKDTASAQSFDRSKPTLSSAIKDDEEESNGDKEHDEDEKEHEEHEDPEVTAKVETNIDMESIMHAVQKLSTGSYERKTITFLDFAGQNIYYAFHQIYLSGATFSILVVDMRKKPEDQCEAMHVSDDDFCCSRFESWTNKGNER